MSDDPYALERALLESLIGKNWPDDRFAHWLLRVPFTPGICWWRHWVRHYNGRYEFKWWIGGPNYLDAGAPYGLNFPDFASLVTALRDPEFRRTHLLPPLNDGEEDGPE